MDDFSSVVDDARFLMGRVVVENADNTSGIVDNGFVDVDDFSSVVDNARFLMSGFSVRVRAIFNDQGIGVDVFTNFRWDFIMSYQV